MGSLRRAQPQNVTWLIVEEHFRTYLHRMKLETTFEGKVAVLRPSGRLLIGEAEDLMNETVARIVCDGRVHLLIDMSGVTAMDSSGVDCLIRAWTLAEQYGGTTKLVNLTPRLQSLLEITGLHTVFEIHSDPQRAVSSFVSESRPRQPA